MIAMSEIADAACILTPRAEFGVTIGVQNHNDIAAGFEALYDLICEVNEPNCRAMFDAWAPFLHGADLQAAAHKLAPVTVHTTIADYHLRPRYLYHPSVVKYTAEKPLVQAVQMGQGSIDYAGFLGALSKAGPRPSVAYEMCSPLSTGSPMDSLYQCARTFLEYMREFQQRAEARETV
jgi:L-ribulose-5-phosphate 3-epimerase